jgi:carboxypeptidase D
VLALLLSFASGGDSLAAGRGEPGPIRRAQVATGGDDADVLHTLHDLDIDIDGAFHDHVRVFVIDEEIAKLRALGLDVRVVPEPPHGTLGAPRPGDATITSIPAEYHTFETLTADLQNIAADHPDIARLVSIGASVQGRELWVMHVSRDPDVEVDEPELLYVGAMHGDEVVGKEMLYHLIDYLTDQDGTDPRVTRALDDTDLWILPSMNPDGTALGRRYNASWVDLNRDFPDQFVDPVNTPAGRQPETAAVMNWASARSISLSANFHGGALVANYPFDSNPSGASVYSPTPSDDLFRSIARTYADANPAMAVSNSHPSFYFGTCNGADWYAISGGLQDWSWVWRGDANLTLEISPVKWPAASALPGYWDDNLESMLQYIERAREGLRGVVSDATTGEPVGAEVRIAGDSFGSFTDRDVGDWHRVVLPGSYDLEIAAEGYVTKLLHDVVVTTGEATRVDVALEPLGTDLQPVGACAGDASVCDPWLPIGESADLKVTLRNTGSDATSIVGTLEPTGWYASMTRPDAAYPDLPTGSTGQSALPGHGVDIASDAPGGHFAGFAVRWDAAEGRGRSEPWFVPIGAPTCATVDATDLPSPIADRATTQSALGVIEDLRVSSVRVGVDVRHTYRGDLRIDLVSPSGTVVTLHDRSGGSADDVVGTFGDDLVPYETFERLRGEPSIGTWTLRVGDEVPSNNGSLEAWSVTVCGRPFEASPPEMRLRDVSVEDASVRLDWWPYPGLTEYRVYRSTDPSLPGSFVDVTAEDDRTDDTTFADDTVGDALYWLVTGIGPAGEGPKGHFDD